jgi:hypothetical protein
MYGRLEVDVVIHAFLILVLSGSDWPVGFYGTYNCDKIPEVFFFFSWPRNFQTHAKSSIVVFSFLKIQSRYPILKQMKEATSSNFNSKLFIRNCNPTSLTRIKSCVEASFDFNTSKCIYL